HVFLELVEGKQAVIVLVELLVMLAQVLGHLVVANEPILVFVQRLELLFGLLLEPLLEFLGSFFLRWWTRRPARLARGPIARLDVVRISRLEAFEVPRFEAVRVSGLEALEIARLEIARLESNRVPRLTRASSATTRLPLEAALLEHLLLFFGVVQVLVKGDLAVGDVVLGGVVFQPLLGPVIEFGDDNVILVLGQLLEHFRRVPGIESSLAPAFVAAAE